MPSDVAKAFLWGVGSACSLVLGAGIALWKLPSEKTRATLMCYGAGALLFALSIELFGSPVCDAEIREAVRLTLDEV